MKGQTLTVNTLIILVLAVIVLIALIAFFLGVWGPSTGGLALEQTKNTACQKYVATNCQGTLASITISDFDADKNGVEGELTDNLGTLCINHYGITTDADCKALCGCP